MAGHKKLCANITLTIYLIISLQLYYSKYSVLVLQYLYSLYFSAIVSKRLLCNIVAAELILGLFDIKIHNRISENTSLGRSGLLRQGRIIGCTCLLELKILGIFRGASNLIESSEGLPSYSNINLAMLFLSKNYLL